MPRYQLQIAVVLALSAVGSLLVFYFTRTKEGKIQLPTHVDESEETFYGPDPFDVTKPEDIIDGYPIDADAFWTRVRLKSSLDAVVYWVLTGETDAFQETSDFLLACCYPDNSGGILWLVCDEQRPH